MFKTAAILALGLFLATPAHAQDEKEALKKKILDAVEKKLKEEEARIITELSKLIDEELAKAKNPAKPPDPKPPVVPDKPKKAAFLGVQPGDPLTDDDKTKLKIDSGVRCNMVADGPAERGGLLNDDIILAIDGEKITDFDQLRVVLAKKNGGTEAIIKILRGNQTKDVKLTLGARGDDPGPGPEPKSDLPKETVKPPTPESEEELRNRVKKFLGKGKDEPKKEEPKKEEPKKEEPKKEEPKKSGKPGWFGIQPEECDKGLTVIELPDGSPAGKAGLKRDDILTKLDATTIKTYDDLGAFMKNTNPGQVIEATVLRDGKEVKIKVTLGEKK